MNITYRRRAEEAVSASEARFHQMYHGHSAVLLVIDPTTGDIVDANKAAACFYGWPISELKAMNIRQINDLPPEKLQARMASAVAAPNARFEFRHRLADGSMRDVEVYGNSIEVARANHSWGLIRICSV